MGTRMEHINIFMTDLDAAIAFLRTAMPDFRVRARHSSPRGEWCHVGNDEAYLALEWHPNRPIGHNGQYNHVGLVVDDVAAVAQRLRAAGYRPGYLQGQIQNEVHRLRVYFHDPDGNEFEFIQYLTDDPALRNKYES